MKYKTDILAEYLRSILTYEPLTGRFTWRPRPGDSGTDKMFNRKYAGKSAGWKCTEGYIKIGIDDSDYPAHRLAYLYMTGDHPSHEIDHINMDRSDNRWGNLRSATRSQNRANTKARMGSKNGLKGVYWRAATNRWEVRLRKDGRCHRFGSHTSKQAAIDVHWQAHKQLHGEFARSI